MVVKPDDIEGDQNRMHPVAIDARFRLNKQHALIVVKRRPAGEALPQFGRLASDLDKDREARRQQDNAPLQNGISVCRPLEPYRPRRTGQVRAV